MSLIHDALRRLQAQESCGPGAAGPETPYLPVLPARSTRRRWWTVATGLLVGAGCVLLWEGWRGLRMESGPGWSKDRPAGTSRAREPLRPDDRAGWQVKTADPIQPGQEPATVIGAGAGQTTEMAEAAVVEVGASALRRPDSEAGGAEQPAGSSAEQAGLLGEPPELRLQGIIYWPSRPLAVLNQRTVGLGGSVAGWTVVAIEADRVVVIGHGRTNLLELP